MSQYSGSRQQLLAIALAAFNQYGDALTIHQLAACLSVPSGNIYPYISSKPELIRQLVNYALTRVRQSPSELSHLSPTEELRVLLTTYSESFTAFRQTALFDLRLHYPEEWERIRELRRSHWERIAAIIETGAANGQLRSVNSNLVRMMVDGMLLDPFLQEYISRSELVDILLFGMAGRVL